MAKDKQWKYHGLQNITIIDGETLRLKLAIQKMCKKSGHRFYKRTIRFLTPSNFRNYLITMMDNVEKYH